MAKKTEFPKSSVAVRKSPIHGRGLFAAARIRKGTLIGAYEGKLTNRIGPYVLWIEDESGREFGIDGKNEMRYVNHSREPNAVFMGEELRALRGILPGEEITHDYGDEWLDET